MKKQIVILLSSIVFVLSSCGNTNSNNNTDTNSQSDRQTTITTETKVTKNDSEEYKVSTFTNDTELNGISFKYDKNSIHISHDSDAAKQIDLASTEEIYKGDYMTLGVTYHIKLYEDKDLEKYHGVDNPTKLNIEGITVIKSHSVSDGKYFGYLVFNYKNNEYTFCLIIYEKSTKECEALFDEFIDTIHFKDRSTSTQTNTVETSTKSKHLTTSYPTNTTKVEPVSSMSEKPDNTEREKKFEEANQNARNLYLAVATACNDLIHQPQIQIDTGIFGPVKLDYLDPNDPIQKEVKEQLNGVSGYVMWKINSSHHPDFVQWCETNENKPTMVGQYPDPEIYSDSIHYFGVRF